MLSLVRRRLAYSALESAPGSAPATGPRSLASSSRPRKPSLSSKSTQTESEPEPVCVPFAMQLATESATTQTDEPHLLDARVQEFEFEAVAEAEAEGALFAKGPEATFTSTASAHRQSGQSCDDWLSRNVLRHRPRAGLQRRLSSRSTNAASNGVQQVTLRTRHETDPHWQSKPFLCVSSSHDELLARQHGAAAAAPPESTQSLESLHSVASSAFTADTDSARSHYYTCAGSFNELDRLATHRRPSRPWALAASYDPDAAFETDEDAEADAKERLRQEQLRGALTLGLPAKTRSRSRLSLPPESELDQTLIAPDFHQATTKRLVDQKQQQEHIESELEAAYKRLCDENTRLRDRLEVFERVSDLMNISLEDSTTASSPAAGERIQSAPRSPPAGSSPSQTLSNASAPSGTEAQQQEDSAADLVFSAALFAANTSNTNPALNRTSSPIPTFEPPTQHRQKSPSGGHSVSSPSPTLVSSRSTCSPLERSSPDAEGENRAEVDAEPEDSAELPRAERLRATTCAPMSASGAEANADPAADALLHTSFSALADYQSTLSPTPTPASPLLGTNATSAPPLFGKPLGDSPLMTASFTALLRRQRAAQTPESALFSASGGKIGGGGGNESVEPDEPSEVSTLDFSLPDSDPQYPAGKCFDSSHLNKDFAFVREHLDSHSNSLEQTV